MYLIELSFIVQNCHSLKTIVKEAGAGGGEDMPIELTALGLQSLHDEARVC